MLLLILSSVSHVKCYQIMVFAPSFCLKDSPHICIWRLASSAAIKSLSPGRLIPVVFS